LLNLREIYYNTFLRFLNNYKQKSSYAYRYNHIYIKKRITQNLKFTLPVTTFSIMWIVDRFITILSMDLFIKYNHIYIKKRITQNLKFTLPVTTFSIMWIVDRFITILSMDLFIKYSILYLLFLYIKPK
jgi:hypothetical protein